MGRQFDEKYGAAGCRFKGKVTAVVLDDHAADGQAQSEAELDAVAAGSEAVLEKPTLDSSGNARAIVLDCNLYPAIRPKERADRQPTFPVHRLGGVDDQVHPDLLEA